MKFKYLFFFLITITGSTHLQAQTYAQSTLEMDANTFIRQSNSSLQAMYRSAEQRQKISAQKLSLPSDPFNLQQREVEKILSRLKSLKKTLRQSDSVYLGDTLVVGFTPGEVLLIDSDWTHKGTIFVLGDGKIIFKKTKATILGNLFAVQEAKVIADSSELYFPQEYFYQRMLLATDDATLEFHHTTLDFGGLVHNLAVAGSASIIFDHVAKADFSTVGLYGNSSFIIDSVDVAGEFIVTDSVKLEISHAKTVLVWHQFSDTAVVDFSFPKGDSIDSYLFNNSYPGVNGVMYNIELENCSEVMWGLMPSNGSEVTITDSKLRTIGLWFEGNDTTTASGLVNNTHYENFLAPLSDRSLQLINTDVQTWSIYTFDDTFVKIKGNIVGEIGVMGRSEAEVYNTYIDGSGGYFFASDTTFSVIGFGSLTSSLRTSGSGMHIFAFSTMMNGQVQALDKSVMILVQSNLTAEPTYDPGSVVWMANIDGPSSALVNKSIQVMGSAWIDKGNTSTWMDFDHYEMFYQPVSDTTKWISIEGKSYNEVKKSVLATWDPEGLEPGAYYLKLELTDDWGNIITATRPITLLPAVLGLAENENSSEFRVYPNPAEKSVTFTTTSGQKKVSNLLIYNSKGATVFTSGEVLIGGDDNLNVDCINWPKGFYFYTLSTKNELHTGKFIKY